jgi:hypothetical protein
MEKSILKLSTIALLACATMVSCKKDNTTTSSSGAEVAFALTADNATSTLGTTSANGPVVNATAAVNASINWTSAIANISRFKLEAKKNGIETEIHSKNISGLDLFSLNQASITALIDTGTYSEIEIKVLLVKSSGADIPLTVKGVFTSAGGAVVPIEFDYNDNAILKSEVENVTVDGTSDVTAKLSLHLNKLLSRISSAEIDAATRTNGTIIISNSSNAAIYNKVIANIILAFEARGFEKHTRKGR